jgi:hypothetical protein
MSRSGLGRIWGILGALLALCAIGTMIVLQGGKSFAEIPGLDAKSPVTSAYLGIPIIGTLLGILGIIGLLYMRTERKQEEGLFPIVAVADLGPHRMATISMLLYQGFFVLVFLLIPAFSLYQLGSVVLQRGVLWHEGDPALGSIVLKNAFAWSQGESNLDAKEHACSSEVIRDARDHGYTWLGNQRCDFVKAARLKPFLKDGDTLAQNVEAAAKTCIRELAQRQTPDPNAKAQPCGGVRDISEACETSERTCRGVQWLPILSPILLVVPTIFGWAMFAWLLIEAICKKVGSRATQRHSEPR